MSHWNCIRTANSNVSSTTLLSASMNRVTGDSGKRKGRKMDNRLAGSMTDVAQV